MSTSETGTRATSWWAESHGAGDGALAAYFSMEFGLDARLPIYSGGLGILAGDYLKAAAELGLPLVGVGLLYRGGYFRQSVDAAGRQREEREAFDPAAFGLAREPVTVHVDLAGEAVEIAVWRHDVGIGAALFARRRRDHRRASTAATASTGSARSSCSGSAACVRSPRSGSHHASTT